jgi:competence protein ComEA
VSLSRRARIAAWLAERMPATLQGRIRLGAREFGALALVLGVGLALAGVMAIRAGGDSSSPVSARVTTSVEPGVSGGSEPLIAPASPSAPAGAPASSAAGSSSGSATATVVVDVAGKVRRPGVITLPAGSRVVDAIDKAGGAGRKVDLSGLNLARVLVDGEQVLVGQAPAPGIAVGAASSPGVPAAGALLNLNTATLEQLDALPGVGPVTAQKILGWRQQHGSFSSVDELLEIDGIGEKTLADLAPMVTL